MDGKGRRKVKTGSARFPGTAKLNALYKFTMLVVALSFISYIHAEEKKPDTEDANTQLREMEFFRLMMQAPSRPSRIDNGTYNNLGKLRYENISDTEVREVQAVADTLNPGAIVEIGGVTEGCPCEDGPLCTNQVWVVSHRQEHTKGFMLSMIEGSWTLGPVQKWWLEYEALLEDLDRQGKSQSLWYAERRSALYLHYKSMPTCKDGQHSLE